VVGGAITILKIMKVNGKDDIPYMKWKIIKKKCLKPPTRQILKHQDYPPFSKRGKRDPPNSMEVYSWEKHGPKRENSYDSRMVMICTVMMLSMAHIWFCKAISIHIP
jgi:hypothetical protein